MDIKDRVLLIDAELAAAHALLNQLAMRDTVQFPLPAEIEGRIVPAIRKLTNARDALHDLAEGREEN